MADYPEDLNPFKRRSAIRESFRSLKSAFSGPFRHKKKEKKADAVVPKTEEVVTLRHQESPESSVVYPRSRFKERVAKAQTIATTPTSNAEAPNPFEEAKRTSSPNGPTIGLINRNEELEVEHRKVENGSVKPPRRHRRKKRSAPLPPGALGNHLNVSGEYNSQWSISSYGSYDTEYSSTAYTQSETELETEEHPERLRDIQEISKEIQQLCNDNEADEISANATTITAQDDCPNGANPVESTTITPPNIVVTSNNVDAINNSIMEQPLDTSVTTDAAETSDAIAAEEIKIEDTNNNEINDTSSQNGLNADVESHNGNVVDMERCDTNDKAIISKETKGVEESYDDRGNTIEKDSREEMQEDNAQIEYVQRKSLYIAGSMDDLDIDYNASTKLYITGSVDQLDADNNGAAQTEKVRKHKLSRDELLGSSGDVMNTAGG